MSGILISVLISCKVFLTSGPCQEIGLRDINPPVKYISNATENT